MNIHRRRFLGHAALEIAAVSGLTSLTLNSAQAATGLHRLDPSLAQPARPLSGQDRVPVIVVGTGYGGAVAALRLAESGVPVVMLEMGNFWTKPAADGNIFSKTLTPDGRTMWFKTKTEAPLKTFLYLDVINRKIPSEAGVLDRVNFKEMSVYLGRGVGGGSLVNGAMAVTPKRSYFEEVLPQVDAQDMYARWFPLANATLGVRVVNSTWFEQAKCFQYARVGRDVAHKIGYKTAFVPTVYDLDYLAKEERGEVTKSALGLEVIYGNNHGKKSLDKTYLADAVGTGKVSIYSLHEVTSITQDNNGDQVLGIKHIDNLGNVIDQFVIRCGKLILAAGSVGTSSLLVKARDTGTLPRLSGEVGNGWGNNGNVMAARTNAFGIKTGSVQSTMPMLGIDEWDNPAHPVFAEITPLPTGFENRTSMYLGVTRNPERAKFVYNSQTGRVDLDWRKSQAAKSVADLKALLDPINKMERTIYRTDLFGEGRSFVDDFTYHPLGGCLLGKATDNYGRVHGHPGLYVMDGSLIPGSVGVNPFVTITALVERNMQHVLSHDSWI
jgi:cholesterol oxidase